MIKAIFVAVLIGLLPFNLISQEYQISSFQGEYIELEDYNSLILQTGGVWPLWHIRIDLDFDFPYFDTTFSYIDGRNGSSYGFEGSQSSNILLFTVAEELDQVVDIFDIQSDVRYGFREENGLKCLIVQYTKVRFRNDPSIWLHDSYLNYQHCFCEDGSIELRIGDMNLENSPGYSPGEGFFLIFNNGNVLIPTGVQIGVENFDDEGYFFYGTHEQYQIINSWYESHEILNVPPMGWTFRFERQPTNTHLIQNNEPIIHIFPNPVGDRLHFTAEGEKPDYFRITNGLGRLEMSFTPDGEYIDVSNLAPGLYHIVFKTNDNYYTQSFLKK